MVVECKLPKLTTRQATLEIARWESERFIFQVTKGKLMTRRNALVLRGIARLPTRRVI